MIATLQLALICLRTGVLVFGGGLVMVPLLEADIVQKYQWLTHQEFLDAVALGQMTPGPVLVTVTLVGYKLSGLFGAILAPLCMFLPAFLLTLFCANRLQKLQRFPIVKRILWGLKPAVVGLIVAAGIQLAQTHLTAPGPIILGVAALALLVLWEKVDAGLVVVGSGLLGLLLWVR
jgi:chromate transporter